MSRSVPQAFAESAERHSARIALAGEDGQVLSFEQLDRLRLDAARALLALGVQPGERVAVWGQNCVEWVAAGLAIHSAGAVLVPVNTRMKGQRGGLRAGAQRRAPAVQRRALPGPATTPACWRRSSQRASKRS